ncbi:hypothetical protein [Enterobacter cloacae]|uniref:hypothetical protein n=1 Tax=Enterobacter cloacae TaxID=550 RepID=UPI002FF68918
MLIWLITTAVQGCAPHTNDLPIQLINPVNIQNPQQFATENIDISTDKPDIDPSESGLPKPGLVSGPSLPGVNAPVPQPTDPLKVTIFSQSGHMLTAWSRTTNAYLWAYYPWDAESFADLRHWIIERGSSSGTLQLRNADTDECLNVIAGSTKLSPGRYSHATCNGPESDVELEPVEGGGFLLRSVFTNQCMAVSSSTSTGGFAYYVLQSGCPNKGEQPAFTSQVWYFASVMDPSLASIAKAQIHIAPVFPVDPDIPPEDSGSDRGKMMDNYMGGTE